MDTPFADKGSVSLSFFALVDQLALRYSADNNKVCQLVSAALACADFSNVDSEAIQRLWGVALSVSAIGASGPSRSSLRRIASQAHHSPLSNEAETRLTKLIRTELKAAKAGVAKVLRCVSPIFRQLLSAPSVQNRNSFRTMWNVTFGKVQLSEREIPQDLLPLLLERWIHDNTAFEMPIWAKAKEESQAARAAITTIDYEADSSGQIGESQISLDDQTSRSRRARSGGHSDNPPAASSSLLPKIPSSSSTSATTQQNAIAKGRTAVKRTGKKSRKRSRASEPKQEEASRPARDVALRPEVKGLGEVSGKSSRYKSRGLP